MNLILTLSTLAALVLFVYLLAALFFPENFS